MEEEQSIEQLYSDGDIDKLAEPIDWSKDKDTMIINKIKARSDDSKLLYEKKKKECRVGDAYFDGEPERVKGEPCIYNVLFSIIRNMSGLLTDPRPNPAVRVAGLKKDMPKEEKMKKLQVAKELGDSLEELWDDIQGQSKFQRIVLGMQTYSDMFVMPFFNTKTDDADFEMLSPVRVKIDPNAESIETADYTIAVFYRSKTYMYSKWGKKETKDVKYFDYTEAQTQDMNDGEDPSEHKNLKNVAKVELYMEREWFVYRSGNILLEKKRNPLWANDEESQKTDTKNKVMSKYKKDGIAGVGQKVADTAKGIVGMETTDDKMAGELEATMANFKPQKNYFKYPKIPLIQFDTYRFAGEQYSRSLLKQSVKVVDDINSRRTAITENTNAMGKPNTYVDGTIMNEKQANRIESGKAKGEVVRLKTSNNKSIRENIYISQGVAMSSEAFNSIGDDKRELDNMWGHHEVSKGGSDPANKTKGGILALQEADQTPIRFLTRNIEDSMQELFQWFVQIRKMYKADEPITLGDGAGEILYSDIDANNKVYIKSGSMMPVSGIQQRDEAMELWKSQALDPLTLFERLNDPEPKKTAKRLEAWLREKKVLDEGDNEQEQRVLQKIKLIQANQFEQVQVLPDDDPRVHHDMLLMALQNGEFTPEQEEIIAQLIDKYAKMVEGSSEEGQGGDVMQDYAEETT